METMENVNRLLLQNVLPLHVASFFMGKTIRNQVNGTKLSPYYPTLLSTEKDWQLRDRKMRLNLRNT